MVIDKVPFAVHPGSVVLGIMRIGSRKRIKLSTMRNYGEIVPGGITRIRVLKEQFVLSLSDIM